MYYHTMGYPQDLGKFRIGKAFSRAAHITKTSFQPKKILGAIGSVTAGFFTAGLGPALAPKLFSANSSTMKSLGMGVVAIVAVAGAVVMAPAIAGALGPTFSSGAALAGKAVTGMTTFMSAWKKLSPAKAQQLSSELTPQQVADIESGKAQLTENGVEYGNQVAMPGSLMVQGQNVPLAPWETPRSPLADLGPSAPGGGRTSEAGLIGGLSPLLIGLMIGVPVIMQLVFKDRGIR